MELRARKKATEDGVTFAAVTALSANENEGNVDTPHVVDTSNTGNVDVRRRSRNIR